MKDTFAWFSIYLRPLGAIDAPFPHPKDRDGIVDLWPVAIIMKDLL
ncbi:hypothetical protein P0Y35_15215 [Kiritimatiellaeota bacterium B1221]|nr:hypothetical protein [Kiritimatiellaeota bacterium B1221]